MLTLMFYISNNKIIYTVLILIISDTFSNFHFPGEKTCTDKQKAKGNEATAPKNSILMLCRFCRDHDPLSQWSTFVIRTIRNQTYERHELSQEHIAGTY